MDLESSGENSPKQLRESWRQNRTRTTVCTQASAEVTRKQPKAAESSRFAECDDKMRKKLDQDEHAPCPAAKMTSTCPCRCPAGWGGATPIPMSAVITRAACACAHACMHAQMSSCSRRYRKFFFVMLRFPLWLVIT